MTSPEGDGPKDVDEQPKTPDEDFGIHVPVEAPEPQQVGADSGQVVPDLSEEELERATFLRAQVGNTQVDVLRRKYSLEDAIRAIALDELKHIPTRLAKETVDSTITQIAPTPEDRKLLLTKIMEEKLKAESDLETPRMKRMGNTGQEHHYPEYKKLLEENSRLYAVIEYLAELEERILEQAEAERKMTDDLVDFFNNEALRMVFDTTPHETTLRRLFDGIEELINYKKDQFGKRIERTPAEQITIKDDISYELSRKLKSHEIALLIKRFREDESTEEYANLLEDLR